MGCDGHATEGGGREGSSTLWFGLVIIVVVGVRPSWPFILGSDGRGGGGGGAPPSRPVKGAVIPWDPLGSSPSVVMSSTACSNLDMEVPVVAFFFVELFPLPSRAPSLLFVFLPGRVIPGCGLVFGICMCRPPAVQNKV